MVESDGIHLGERFSVSFLRTLRIPDDGRTYPLPPGLGRFPLLKVEDYRDRVPEIWRKHGGVFLPMYQREALWLGFHAASWKPNAVKISLGGVNAISGEPDNDELHLDPQNYFVCPEQPWLDGIRIGRGAIRQFVAMPLGQGYSIEAAMTGAEVLGGMRIVAFEPNPGVFPDSPPVETRPSGGRVYSLKQHVQEMGIGAGGVMTQKIYADPYGLAVWDQRNYGQVWVHIVNSWSFHELTGMPPPPTPIDPQAYTQHGLPWFTLYDEKKREIAAPGGFTEVRTITARDTELGKGNGSDDSVEVSETQVKKLSLADTPATPTRASRTKRRRKS
ncbi:MAG: hypothetical protein AB7P69_13430 [Candidatus Binatia bacterium]